MNSSGKQLVAFWLHRKGEHWSVKSVDKENSTSEVSYDIENTQIMKILYIDVADRNTFLITFQTNIF